MCSDVNRAAKEWHEFHETFHLRLCVPKTNTNVIILSNNCIIIMKNVLIIKLPIDCNAFGLNCFTI
jgi:hypothetical protein